MNMMNTEIVKSQVNETVLSILVSDGQRVKSGQLLAELSSGNTQLEYQQQRNAFLQSKIAELDIQIKDIASLKAEIASLKARQKAVEDLQIDRNVPVHVLNELVRQVPEGIYVTSVKQDGANLNVAGIAQTQERVSEFLRNTTYGSEWLVKPELVESKATVIQGTNKGEQKRLFDFSVRLTIKRPQDGAASAPPGAGARPLAASASASAPIAPIAPVAKAPMEKKA